MTIFEQETEIGKFDGELLETAGTLGSFGGEGILCAYTLASLTGSRQVLKIDQRCYVRFGNDVADQEWIKPELLLEPALGSETELVSMAQRLHEQLVGKVKEQIPVTCAFPV